MFDAFRSDRLLAIARSLWSRLRGSTPVVVKNGDDAAALLRAQVAVVKRALDGNVALAGKDGSRRSADDGDVSYLYRPGHANVRQDRIDDVMRYFDDRSDEFRTPAERVSEPIPGLILLRLPVRADGADDVLATLNELDEAFGVDGSTGPIASPDHLLYVTIPVGHLCPYGEPEVPESRNPSPRFFADPSAGREVRVSVVDTGLWEPATTIPETPWLHDGVEAKTSDQEVINQKAIHEYGGHGTFVAGVIKQAAPLAHIQVEGALTHGGAVYESEIVAQMHQAYLETEDPQLISISAGTHSRNDFALIGFDALADALGLEGSETLVIAAAGNDSSPRPFWPAAFDWAIGVGAVDANGKVASYSNYGPWVDVYALGTGHINAFPIGTYHCYEPANAGQVRQFQGLARWSGTSFATPVVTGLVAAEKSRTQQDVRSAAAAVIKAGTPGSDPTGRPIAVVGPLT